MKLVAMPMALAVAGAMAAVLNPQECTSLGIDVTAIDCDSCRHDDDGRQDCLECCTPATTYPTAQLRLVQNYGRSIPGFTVEYQKGQKPHLLLFDAEGNMRQKVEVETWKEESIRDYLSLVLRHTHRHRDEL
ncbi:hypothetical protein ACHHYP_07591 [Achlya hypogyna]|uniref:Selenoprotein F n=1 Tax=Achlya hypogyna TaxID=1202772 RepID=A0A0A7CNS8_ACHHY|nr:secreted protein [Achlya hypogyna]OQR98923.1 hypothetical protein ACHHYP_07591 [Achlya hypogyna]